MLRKTLAISFMMAASALMAIAAENNPAPANLSAAEIVNKNIEARGGLQAWRAVQSLSMEGKMGVGGNKRAAMSPELPPPGKKMAQIPSDPRPKEEVQLPFTMYLQRPHKERVELLFNGKKAIQVYDGDNGWKLRPYLNRLEVETYSANELKISSTQAELDGYLVDYASKGTRLELEGMEKVENRDDYKLKLTLKTGQQMHLWIDAQTYLETKVEGQPRVLDDVKHQVEVYYRDYRAVNGLKIPFTLETRVLPAGGPNDRIIQNPVPPEKISIDKVTVNPKLDASLFTKPHVETASVTR